MANSNSKKDTSNLSTFGFMHKVLHNFSDWEIETCHMTRTERSIYFDMRTLYLKLGKPLTDDMELLSRRLRCVNNEELTALGFLLKDKFRHDKKTKTYRQAEWDLILKNYKFRHKTGNGGTECETHDETQNTMTKRNDETQCETPNKDSERLKAWRERHKKMVTALNSFGIKANSRMTSKQLTELCEQHDVTLNDEMRNDDETVKRNDETQCETPNQREISAITKNHKPITINQEPNTQTPPNPQEQKSGVCVADDKTAETVLAKAEQIRQANAQDIQDWQAPSLDEMKSMLTLSGFSGTLPQQQYETLISDMKNHFAEQAILGKPVVTDNLRKQKLRDWIMRNASKPLTGKSNQPQYGGINDPMAVNAKWGIVEDYAPTMTIDELMAEKEAKRLAREQASQSTATANPNRQPKGLIEL